MMTARQFSLLGQEMDEEAGRRRDSNRKDEEAEGQEDDRKGTKTPIDDAKRSEALRNQIKADLNKRKQQARSGSREAKSESLRRLEPMSLTLPWKNSGSTFDEVEKWDKELGQVAQAFKQYWTDDAKSKPTEVYLYVSVTTNVPLGYNTQILSNRSVKIRMKLLELGVPAKLVVCGATVYNDKPKGPRVLISPLTEDGMRKTQETEAKLTKNRETLRKSFDNGEQVDTGLLFNADSVKFQDEDLATYHLQIVADVTARTKEIVLIKLVSSTKPLSSDVADLLDQRGSAVERLLQELGLKGNRIRLEDPEGFHATDGLILCTELQADGDSNME
jgi:hypothetical protein